MAKKADAKSTKEVIDIILELINIWTVPVIAAIALLWGFVAMPCGKKRKK